jgi:HAD superfamily hydrolase (TIGR01509 family)
MSFRGMLFDFNGVLLWDEPQQMESWARYAEQIRGRAFSTRELDERVAGRTVPDVLAYLLGRAPSAAEVERCVREKEGLYRDLCLALGKGFRLSPGAEDLLEDLARRGVPRAIATASPSVNVEFFRRELRLDRWFPEQAYVYDDGRKAGKPAPDYYLHAARAIGVLPAACVVAEDSLSGLAAALAAGAGAVFGVNSTGRLHTGNAPAGVRGILPSLAELPRGELFDA